MPVSRTLPATTHSTLPSHRPQYTKLAVRHLLRRTTFVPPLYLCLTLFIIQPTPCAILQEEKKISTAKSMAPSHLTFKGSTPELICSKRTNRIPTTLQPIISHL